MIKKRLARWSVVLSASAFAIIPGCDGATGIFDQLLGVVGLA